jgi:GTPase involved in cell partitioning and DNA repair
MMAGNMATDAMSLGTNVAYNNGTAAQLIDGSSVEVEATKGPNGFVAYCVTFVHAAPPMGGGVGGKIEPILVRGRVSQVTASSFVVNSVAIQINGVTPQNDPLEECGKAEVWFMPAGTTNLAQSIDVAK